MVFHFLFGIFIIINVVHCSSEDSDYEYAKLNNSSSELLDSDFANTDMDEFRKKIGSNASINSRKKDRYESYKALWNRRFRDNNDPCNDSDSDVTRGVLSDYCRRVRKNKPSSKIDAKEIYRKRHLAKENMEFNEQSNVFNQLFTEHKLYNLLKTSKPGVNERMRRKLLEEEARKRLQNIAVESDADSSSNSSYERQKAKKTISQTQNKAGKSGQKKFPTKSTTIKEVVNLPVDNSKERERLLKEKRERWAKMAAHRKEQLKEKNHSHSDSDESLFK